MKQETPEILSPIGKTVDEGSQHRASRNPEYREEVKRLQEFENIARLVIRLRLDHGLTQQQLAQRVGTSHSAISRIESGQHKTSVETLRRIARAFGGHLLIGIEAPDANGNLRRDLAKV